MSVATTDAERAAAAEERFSREKGTGAFPVGAIQYCLQAGGLTLDDIDYVAHGFSYEPFRSLFENHWSRFTKRKSVPFNAG